MLKSGASPNEGGSSTPLAIAIRGRKRDVVKALLGARGVEVDAIDRKTGATPLQLAAAFGEEDSLTLLLRAGADRTLVTGRKLDGVVLRSGNSGMKVEKKSHPSGLTAAKLAKAAGLPALAKQLA